MLLDGVLACSKPILGAAGRWHAAQCAVTDRLSSRLRADLMQVLILACGMIEHDWETLVPRAGVSPWLLILLLHGGVEDRIV